MGAYKGKRVMAERRNRIENQPVSLGLVERWSDGSLQVGLGIRPRKYIFYLFILLRSMYYFWLCPVCLYGFNPSLLPPPLSPLSLPPSPVPRDGVHGAGRARGHLAHPLRAHRGANLYCLFIAPYQPSYQPISGSLSAPSEPSRAPIKPVSSPFRTAIIPL